MKIFPLVVLLILSAFTTISAEETYASKYSSYVGKEPSPKFKSFMDIPLTDLEVDEKSLLLALDSLQNTVGKQSKVGGLSFIIKNPDTPAYQKPIKIGKGTMKLSDAIDSMCQQAGATWDFSSGKLTIKPRKEEAR